MGSLIEFLKTTEPVKTNLELKAPAKSTDPKAEVTKYIDSQRPKVTGVHAVQRSTIPINTGESPSEFASRIKGQKPVGVDAGSKKDLPWGDPTDIGMTALSVAPNTINQLQTDPTNATEHTGKVLSMAADGAKLGTAVLPGIGTAVGAAVFAGAAIIDSAGYKDRVVAKADKETVEKNSEIANERLIGFLNSQSSKQLEQQESLYKKINGYSSNSTYNS